ncbi:MAG TPA: hypothetical protein VF525_00155 [Pyrinomonadaceae bacterium]|jgi:hypothetical protein
MTHEQLINEIKQLPLEQRVELLKIISRSVREEMQPRVPGWSVDNLLRNSTKPDNSPLIDQELPAHTEAQFAGQDGMPISQLLHGVIKFEGAAPTDEELKDIYADHLLEKYS